MDALNSEQLAFVAARAFAKIWMARYPREGMLPFQKFCLEVLQSTQITVPIVMLALLYVHRFRQRYPNLRRGHGSEYGMFVVALMLSSKFLEDNTFTVQTWSEVSHHPVKELINMQRDFLQALDHRLHVADTEYSAWIGRLQTIVLANGVSSETGTFVAPGTPQSMSAFSPVDSMRVPSEADFQVVPSPTVPLARDSLLADLVPSPPAKRMRYSAQQPCRQQVHPVPELVSLPTAFSSNYVLPQMYTPPSSSSSRATTFSRGGSEFTFKVPAASSAYAPPPHGSAGMITYPQSTQAFGAVPTYLPSSLMALASTISPPPPANAASAAAAAAAYGSTPNSCCGGGLPASAAIPQQHFGVQPLVSGGLGYTTRIMNTNPPLPHYQQQQPSFSTAAAAASALVSQYPALYYGGVPTFCPNAGGAMPIYNYGA